MVLNNEDVERGYPLYNFDFKKWWLSSSTKDTRKRICHYLKAEGIYNVFASFASKLAKRPEGFTGVWNAIARCYWTEYDSVCKCCWERRKKTNQKFKHHPRPPGAIKCCYCKLDLCEKCVKSTRTETISSPRGYKDKRRKIYICVRCFLKQNSVEKRKQSNVNSKSKRAKVETGKQQSVDSDIQPTSPTYSADLPSWLDSDSDSSLEICI